MVTRQAIIVNGTLSTEVIKVAFFFNAWATGLCAVRVCCGRDRLLLVCSLLLCPIVRLNVALASVQETQFDTTMLSSCMVSFCENRNVVVSDSMYSMGFVSGKIHFLKPCIGLALFLPCTGARLIHRFRLGWWR